MFLSVETHLSISFKSSQWNQSLSKSVKIKSDAKCSSWQNYEECHWKTYIMSSAQLCLMHAMNDNAFIYLKSACFGITCSPLWSHCYIPLTTAVPRLHWCSTSRLKNTFPTLTATSSLNDSETCKCHQSLMLCLQPHFEPPLTTPIFSSKQQHRLESSDFLLLALVSSTHHSRK